jgi:hypothetical protein
MTTQQNVCHGCGATFTTELRLNQIGHYWHVVDGREGGCPKCGHFYWSVVTRDGTVPPRPSA